jgi:hypothetical protein
MVRDVEFHNLSALGYRAPNLSGAGYLVGSEPLDRWMPGLSASVCGRPPELCMPGGRLGARLRGSWGVGFGAGVSAGWGEVLGLAGVGSCGRVPVRPRSSSTDRASAFGAEGWGFESLRGRHFRRWSGSGFLYLRISGIAAVRAGKRPRIDAQNNHSHRAVKVSDSGPEGPHQRLSADGRGRVETPHRHA